MSKALITIIALIAVFFVGLFVAIPPPFTWARDAAIAALAALAGVQWSVYTSANDPDKLAKFVAKHLPAAEVMKLIKDGRDAFSTAVAKAKGIILNE